VQTLPVPIDPVEREAGIEPASLAWKAKVLPLNYSRIGRNPADPGGPAGSLPPGRLPSLPLDHFNTFNTSRHLNNEALVEEAGFEPA